MHQCMNNQAAAAGEAADPVRPEQVEKVPVFISWEPIRGDLPWTKNSTIQFTGC